MAELRTAVVILNWNGRHWLEAFLGEVVRHSPEAEVVVADNASTDDSLSWVRAHHPEVQVIETGGNFGYAGGYDRALARLDHDVFVLLNSDVQVTEGWLRPLLDRMASDPAIGACQPKVRWHAHPERFEYAGACGGFIDRWGYPFCRGRLFDTLETDTGQYDDARPVFWATGACLVVRRAAFEAVGGLDESLFAHMEEIDLCWRMQNAGWSVWVEPASTVFHVGGGTLPMGSPRKTYLNFRNNLILLAKNLPARAAVAVVFIRMVLDGIAAWRMLFTGDGRGFLAVGRAHGAFYLRLPRTIRARRGAVRAPQDLSGWWPGSVVRAYFLRGVRRFSDLAGVDRTA